MMKKIMILTFLFSSFSLMAQNQRLSLQFLELSLGECVGSNYEKALKGESFFKTCKKEIVEMINYGATEEEVYQEIVEDFKYFKYHNEKEENQEAEMNQTLDALEDRLSNLPEALGMTSFRPKEFIRCSEGDHDSKALVLHPQQSGSRLLSVAGGKDIAMMDCSTENQKIICDYEKSSLFGSSEKTLTLDLDTLFLNNDLSGNPDYYILDGDNDGDSLICRQYVN